MNLRLIAACATAAFAAPALAEGSVTLSGVMDAAVRQVDNEGVGSAKSVVSGSNATSRLIFSGREDLGAGLGAGFHLEHGLLADVGTPSSADKFWDRRSTVSLTSETVGELRLGRDYVPSYSVWTRHDPFSYVGVARSANLVSATPTGPIRAAFGSNPNTTVRADNTLQWLPPAGWGGVEGAVMLAPSEGGDAASGRAKVLGVRLGYAAKGFGISAGTTQSENSLTTEGKFRDTVLGAQADVANVKLSAAWRQFKVDDARQTLLLVGAVATWGPHELKASWVKADLSGAVGATAIGANDAQQIGIGYVYNLSKRSALYATAAQISNEGQARYVISDGPPGMGEGGKSRGYELGLRHRF